MILNKFLRNEFYLFIAFIFILISSCKKYPDGPLLSLRIKEHRVVGDWNVDFFSINGNDSTSYFKNQALYGFYSFSKEKEGHAGFSYNSYDHSYGASGEWTFTSNKKNIRIEIDYAVPYSQHFNLGLYDTKVAIDWKIQRLTETEMWLKGNYTDGREYFVKLKLKEN